MKCCQCKDEKLSNEFPTMVTERCLHIPTFCLSCLAEKLDLSNITNKEIRRCPECLEKLSSDDKELLSLAWNKAPFKINVDNIGKVNTDGNNTGEIYIELLDGQRSTLQFSEIKNIPMLRKKIEKKLNVDKIKQRLICNGIELQDLNIGTPNTLESYNIRPGSRIQLMIMEYNFRPKPIEDIIFEFSWGYPATGMDYLDASCLVYKGADCIRKYDYVSQYYPSFPYIRFMGDFMDDKRGRSRIVVQSKKLPAEITHLYFVLSSSKSPNISKFPNPSLVLVDETQPDKPLCSYQIKKAVESQAVIMCCLARSCDQSWNMFEIGKLSDGNIENYEPIKTSITGFDD